MKFLIPIRCINIRFINLGRSYPLATLLLPSCYPLTIPLPRKGLFVIFLYDDSF